MHFALKEDYGAVTTGRPQDAVTWNLLLGQVLIIWDHASQQCHSEFGYRMLRKTRGIPKMQNVF